MEENSFESYQNSDIIAGLHLSHSDMFCMETAPTPRLQLGGTLNFYVIS